jgi:hypothetical protein
MIHIENDEASIHPSVTDNSYPDSDTEMESPSIVRPPTTRRVHGVGRKEKEKRAILRGTVLRQREKLKARNAENAELREIIKTVRTLQVSQKRTSEAVELLLQHAIDNKQVSNEPGNSTPPKRMLPSRTAPTSVSHNRQKSTVSSSAETTTTASSVTADPKELKKRAGDLKCKMKAILKTMKDNRDSIPHARHDSEIINHDVRHDLELVNGEEVHDLKHVSQELKYDSGLGMENYEDGRRPESINRVVRLSLRDKIYAITGLAEWEPNDK